MAPADAVIIDGDHNYYTVIEELRAIAAASGAELPLLMFHDVGWPHGRRDDYYAAELIPAERRQPIQEGGGLHPDESGIRAGGLPYRGAAAREGGPRNGVLTAVEDFVAEREGLRLAIVPAFFGLGIVWSADAPWAEAIAEVLEPWDRNPLLARLEANRVFHLAESHVQLVEASLAQQRVARRDAILRRLLESSAFGVAERLSRLRLRARVAPASPAVSKERDPASPGLLAAQPARRRSAARAVRRQRFARRSGRVIAPADALLDLLQPALVLALAGLVLQLLRHGGGSCGLGFRCGAPRDRTPVGVERAWRPASARPTSRRRGCAPPPSPLGR